MYKINVDAALSIENNIMGIAIIVRDSEGLFMAGKSVQTPGCLQPKKHIHNNTKVFSYEVSSILY